MERDVKIIVLGAGVIGTTVAWYLNRDGHEVTVLDRQGGAGLETSFANGGQISACHAEPWANPTVLPKLARWLGREDAPLLFRWNRWDPALWAWGIRFLSNCTGKRARINTERTLRVALYSRACLQAIRAETGLSYDEQTRGILHFYRDGPQFDHARKAAAVMRAGGLPRFEKTPAECLEIEPALATVAGGLAGGIYTPDDESGDAYKFTVGLAERAAAAGVTFETGVTISAILGEGDRVTGIATDRGVRRADAYVLALGSYSPLFTRSLGFSLPIVPAKGYSITVPVGDHTGAPTVSITDDEHKIVYSRLGQRLRVAGTAEMAGWNTAPGPRRTKVLEDLARATFPDGGDYDRAEPWTGLRSVTPDSVPLLGPTPYGNLWLDTGHSTLGWTMACGSGKVVADLISGRTPEIATDGLTLSRFGRV